MGQFSLLVGLTVAARADSPGPISLETYSHRLENVRIDSDLLPPSYTTGTLTASLDVSPPLPSSGGHKVRAVLRDQDGKTVKEQTLAFGKDKLDWKLDDVEGWMTRGGSGAASLATLRGRLSLEHTHDRNAYERANYVQLLRDRTGATP